MMPPAMESPEMEVSAVVSRRLRPTSPLPFVAWGILLVLQAVSPDKAWSWLLVGLGFLILIAYLWARMLRGQVSAERRTLGAWVVAGDHLQEQFTLTNRGQLPVLWARIRDQSEVPGYRVDRVETVGAEGERTWTTTGVCQRRGVFQLGPWAVEMADPLGFFTVTHHHPESTTIMVYPCASRLPDLDLPSGRAPGRASSSQRAIEETILVGGLRAYYPGDPLRRIHWKATARHDVLMVHDFDREPSGDVWLIVDMDSRVQAGREAEATQEYSVILAASLAARFLRQGERRAVGLLISGRRPVMLPPGRGQPQLWRILEALARAEPAPDLELEGLLRQAGLGLGSGRMLGDHHTVAEWWLGCTFIAPYRSRQRTGSRFARRDDFRSTRGQPPGSARPAQSVGAAANSQFGPGAGFPIPSHRQNSPPADRSTCAVRFWPGDPG